MTYLIFILIVILCPVLMGIVLLLHNLFVVKFLKCYLTAENGYATLTLLNKEKFDDVKEKQRQVGKKTETNLGRVLHKKNTHQERKIK